MNTVVIYQSSTGFTKQYASWIAEELGCSAVALKGVSKETMSGIDTVIFGGRFHGGSIDGLKKAKNLFAESNAAKFVVFATGATPGTAEDVIGEAWKNNFTPDEMGRIPHFYMPGGLRYEKMAFVDKLMMKAFAAMMKRNKSKTEYEKGFEQAISSSYDISSKEYIKPIIAECLDTSKNTSI